MKDKKIKRSGEKKDYCGNVKEKREEAVLILTDDGVCEITGI